MRGKNTAIAFFDFDGTITRKDTLFGVIRYFFGKWSFYMGILRLAPSLLLFKLGILPNWKAKEKMLSYFFGGIPSVDFQQKCDQFAAEVIPKILRTDAMQVLERLRDEGVRIVVVTASAENWVGAWCEKQQIQCIGTRLVVSNGKITGKTAGANCHGEEKVNRIKSLFDLDQYTEIYAYGDSKGDLPMLKLASKSYYRVFKN